MSGRPSLYTADIEAEILKRLAEGETLRGICRDEHLPHESTVRLWVLEDRNGISTRYARARELQFETWADEITEIAEDGSNDWMERKRKDGSIETVLDREHIERSKVRIDARKWLMAKGMPKRYGDRQILDVGDDTLRKLSDEAVESRLAQLLGKAGAVVSLAGPGETEGRESPSSLQTIQ